ncbi:hypothetical protein [Escherichia phage ECA2]|uniref:Uncharacterized protein n=1 Tax=Escherichia phage ECA2 TaxID=1852630 RepID=A0A193GYZ5_9CAUD|nr:hypothetical protein HOR17_gp17 [Escherichia phage ECA2]ANN86241.1 hypothetical protein [Escherichia phage ECA2]
MRLNKDTAVAMWSAIESRAAHNVGGIADVARAYEEKGLTFRRFMWDCYHAVGFKETTRIITEHNTVTLIGGHLTDVADAHIETILKVALKDLKY